MYKTDFKMVVRRNVILLLLIILTVSSAFSQGKLSSKEGNSLVEKAEYYYYDDDAKNIPKALKIFERLSINKPEDPYYNLMVGICYSYFKNKKEAALAKLLAVKASNPEFNEVDFYLGRAYAVNGRFDEAVSSYTGYLRTEGVSEEQKILARQNIIYCVNAQVYMEDTMEVEIVNIGAPINTDYSEYVPVITPDESMIIFTYRGSMSKGGLLSPTGKPDNDGHYNEDIMVAYKFGDEWLDPESIAENINTVGHDASIAISTDGQRLFIYKQTKKGGGDIFSSDLKGEEWSKPKKLMGGVNSPAWEGSATLTSDGRMLYFSSSREGGYGGRDIYSAVLQADKTWGEINNLGSVINTPFDDDAPFIHPDKRTLYYSSKGHNSMGGYDIFYSYLTNEGWDEPENVGYPVNTIDDDRYYVLSADAKTGYYSTAGRSENGTHDIYTVSPGHFGKRPILALVVGVVQADGVLAEADITVTNESTGELEGEFKSNSSSGKYMLALTPGNKYKIAIEVEGYDTKVSYIDVESLETYVEVEHDFNVYSEGNEVGLSDDSDPLQNKIDEQIWQYRKENTEEGYHAMVYEKILNERGSNREAGVQYFLDADCVDSVKTDPTIIAKISTISYPDGTYKDVVGPFETLLGSEIAKQKLVLKDSLCKTPEVKIADNGVEKTFKQFYSKEFTKTDFTEDMHGALTDPDIYSDNEKTIDLAGKQEIDLEGDNVKDAGAKTIAGLSFKVEIGAVSDVNDFKLQYLEKYGKITAKVYPDGITRYTFGLFETLEEAEGFKQMLSEEEADQKDAFVTVFVFGQRKTVEEYKEEEEVVEEVAVVEEEVVIEEVVEVVEEVAVVEEVVEVVEEVAVVEEEVVEEAAIVEEVKEVVVEEIVEEIAVIEEVKEVVVEDVKKVVEEVVVVEKELMKGPCETESAVDFSWFIGKDLNDKKIYAKMIGLAKDICADGLEFKVQIGAYRFPKNFKWGHLKQYGQPLILNYPDNITRFTQGQFTTIGKTEVLRQKIIKSGQKDAWITPFYNGKRILLEDLFKVNFYGKSIN